MKIRSGFVSNSSSSSFTCDVCGEDVSGWDLSLSQSGMCQCSNGHTFCEGHQEAGKTLTIEEKRQVLINKWKGYEKSDWMTDEKRAEYIKDEEEKSEDDVEDSYRDYEMDAGIDPSFCPICQFKKVDSGEMYRYLLKRGGWTQETLLADVKNTFATYEDFKNFLKE